MNVQTKEILAWNFMFEQYIKQLKLTDGDIHFLLSVSEDFKTFVENRVK